MAPTFVNFTLLASVLLAVFIPGLTTVYTNEPRGIVCRLPQQSEHVILPDGYVAYSDIGVAYKVSNESLTWTAPRRQCISEGAYLADIDTLPKYSYLMTQINSAKATWTGIHKMHDDTEWVSSRTGLTMRTLPWSSGEPGGDYYCVYADPLQHGLVSYYCTRRYDYVCELSIPRDRDAEIEARIQNAIDELNQITKVVHK